MSLDKAEEKILKRLEKDPNSRTARLLAAILRKSIAEIDPANVSSSLGANDLLRLITRLEGFSHIGLTQLNEHFVVLSKPEACRELQRLGVEISDKFLNRHISERSYEETFGKDVTKDKCRRGAAKLLLTYGEFIHFFRVVLERTTLETVPFPETLRVYANEGDKILNG